MKGEPLTKDHKMTQEERIELIVQTCTQEIHKKLLMSVFEKDRVLVSSLLVLRIMQSEGLLDSNLFNFLRRGNQGFGMSLNREEDVDRETLPWLNDLMWEDLSCLSKIKPFSKENLLDHLVKNQKDWA